MPAWEGRQRDRGRRLRAEQEMDSGLDPRTEG